MTQVTEKHIEKEIQVKGLTVAMAFEPQPECGK